MQTIIALLLVAACVVYVAWQLLRTVRAGNGKAGRCCNKGCGGDAPTVTQPSTSSSEQFIPADALRKRRTRPTASR